MSAPRRKGSGDSVTPEIARQRLAAIEGELRGMLTLPPLHSQMDPEHARWLADAISRTLKKGMRLEAALGMRRGRGNTPKDAQHMEIAHKLLAAWGSGSLFKRAPKGFWEKQSSALHKDRSELQRIWTEYAPKVISARLTEQSQRNARKERGGA